MHDTLFYFDLAKLQGIGGSKGRVTPLPSSGESKFFHFHAVFGIKKLADPLWELVPPRENPGSVTARYCTSKVLPVGNAGRTY